MTFPTPDPVIVLAAKALDCLTKSLNSTPYPMATYGMRVGTEVPHDMDTVQDLCCGGLGYVSVLETTPASLGIAPDIERQANSICKPASWVQTFRLGAVRCVPVMTDDLGGMPSEADWTLAATKIMWDSVALRRAGCCLRSYIANIDAVHPYFTGMSVVIGEQQQGNPLGGCVERFMNVQIQFPNCDCGVIT